MRSSFVSRPLVLIWALSLVLLAGHVPAWAQEEARDPRWARPIQLPYAENFYEVAPGLYRAAQPSREAMKAYEAFGIKTVINLRSRHSDQDLVAGARLTLIEVPMKAWDSEDEDVIFVLRLIKNQPGPILIHCQHGADRTGLTIAMYRLVFQNWTKDQALDELRRGGFGYHKIWVNIPKYIEKVDVAQIRRAVDK